MLYYRLTFVELSTSLVVCTFDVEPGSFDRRDGAKPETVTLIEIVAFESGAKTRGRGALSLEGADYSRS